ncbi:MAG: bifunctional adenosylcobinamide kinase/adenosylcobinamide-phosphate guanylyltransferase [Ruminococcus sp.]|nr:bifunctional adenosylcobinamide kinase/adenosylcobinamide-phosphate guanylyltransferase [Ruminococcus sp.]
MIFIIGGTAQGKRLFAAECLGMTDFSDGGKASYEALMDSEVIVDYHKLVRRLMNDGFDPVTFTENLCSNDKPTAIIMDEVGCGIVPIDKDERIWRENCGRCGCIIAANANTVIRMVCGIPTAIKGELP